VVIVYRDIEQRSPEWFALHVGIPTASDINKIVTSTGKVSAQRTEYLYRLAGERVLGTVEQNGLNTVWTRRGTELEPEARSVYAMENEVEVEEVGFITDDQGRYGCSPDGLILPNKGLEIKCPSLSVFVGYVLGGKLPTEYKVQVQASLFITGLEQWDFFAYYPDMKPFQVTVEPDMKFHEILKEELERFCADLDKAEKELLERQ
jgi:hypothetical protein